MLKDVITKENLAGYARKLKQKGFKPGIDKMSADTAAIWIEINGDQLCRRILNGKYEPMPVSGFTIAKSDGRPRVLSKLTAIDTVIQKCICDYMDETADGRFSSRSFAYRKNRGMTDALSLYCQLGSKHKYAARIDPYSCYDNIDRNILSDALKNFVDEQILVDLIMAFISSPVFMENEIITTEKGIPQGAPISPMLCNIYFDRIDKALEEKQIEFIRYADDIIVFGDSADEAKEYADTVKNILEDELKLKVNKNKYRISASADFTFLGHTFETKHSGLTATQKQSQNNVFADWSDIRPRSNRKTINILSDGILRQKDYSLLFDTDAGDSGIPAAETDTINVYSNVIFDSGSLGRALENGITINIFSNDNHLLGRFVPFRGLKSPSVIYEQLQMYYDSKSRMDLVRKFLLASFHNERIVIRYYKKHCDSDVLAEALEGIDKIYGKIKVCTSYEKALLLEARGRELYYGCFDSFISNPDFTFDKRSKMPPENEVNSLISFGNTVLYNYIAAEINKSSLDIRVGFLHATNKRAESLNLDIAEIFRPLIVDRVVFSLINKRVITEDDFRSNGKGMYMSSECKKIFINAFYDKLGTSLNVGDESLSYREIISGEIRKLVRLFRDGEKYIPYKQVR